MFIQCYSIIFQIFQKHLFITNVYNSDTASAVVFFSRVLYALLQSQNAVSAHLKSTYTLHFGFARSIGLLRNMTPDIRYELPQLKQKNMHHFNNRQTNLKLKKN